MGPVMNLALALIVMTGVLYQGAQVAAFQEEPVVIGSFEDNSVAVAAGLQVGDRIVRVDDVVGAELGRLFDGHPAEGQSQGQARDRTERPDHRKGGGAGVGQQVRIRRARSPADHAAAARDRQPGRTRVRGQAGAGRRGAGRRRRAGHHARAHHRAHQGQRGQTAHVRSAAGTDRPSRHRSRRERRMASFGLARRSAPPSCGTSSRGCSTPSR